MYFFIKIIKSGTEFAAYIEQGKLEIRKIFRKHYQLPIMTPDAPVMPVIP